MNCAMNKIPQTSVFTACADNQWTTDSARGVIWRIAEAGEAGCSGSDALKAVEFSDIKSLHTKLEQGAYRCADTGVQLTLSSWQGPNRVRFLTFNTLSEIVALYVVGQPSVDCQARKVDKENGRSMAYGYYEGLDINKLTSRS
jgi:hypothetical protein